MMNARLAVGREADFALSPVHAMLEQITDAPSVDHVDGILNHADVKKWVTGDEKNELTSEELIRAPSFTILSGDYGVFICSNVVGGFTEVYCAVKPEGRGKWSRLFIDACLYWMFTRTNACEIIMRRPKKNLAALALIRAIHADFQFTNKNAWVFRKKTVDADIYSLTIQQWMKRAPGLDERGRWFARKIWEQAEMDIPKFVDPNSLRYAGAAIEMILNHALDKGMLFLNRWSHMINLERVEISCLDPLALNFGPKIVIFRDDDFWVAA